MRQSSGRMEEMKTQEGKIGMGGRNNRQGGGGEKKDYWEGMKGRMDE